MNRVPALALLLSLALPCLSQTSTDTQPPPPTEPRALLAAAAAHYDFTSPDLKPWHMKVSYQFYGPHGAKEVPTDTGTWEYWYASPKVYRFRTARAGLDQQEWSTTQGRYHRESGANHLRHFEEELPAMLLHPLPGVPAADGAADSAAMPFEERMLPADKPQFPCLVGKPQALKGGPPEGLISRPAIFCFDPSKLALVMEESADGLSYNFGQFVTMQGRYLPRQIVVSYGKQKLFSAAVEVIDGADKDDKSFLPPADATLAPAGGHGEVKAGKILRKTSPVYPAQAKEMHQQGLVLLEATIGTDGKVHDALAVASPSPLLAEAAVNCVKSWQYEPYLLDGQPVEVHTIVHIVFQLPR